MGRPRRHRRWIRRIVPLVALVAPAWGPVSATASGSTALCVIGGSLSVSPGHTMTESGGTVSSGGETGTIDCQGFVDGKRATGLGTLGVDSTHDAATCLRGAGSGTFVLSVPTVSGLVRRVLPFSYDRLAGMVRFRGGSNDTSFAGLIEVMPTEGDCLTAPISRAQYRGQAELRS